MRGSLYVYYFIIRLGYIDYHPDPQGYDPPPPPKKKKYNKGNFVKILTLKLSDFYGLKSRIFFSNPKRNELLFFLSSNKSFIKLQVFPKNLLVMAFNMWCTFFAVLFSSVATLYMGYMSLRPSDWCSYDYNFHVCWLKQQIKLLTLWIIFNNSNCQKIVILCKMSYFSDK